MHTTRKTTTDRRVSFRLRSQKPYPASGMAATFGVVAKAEIVPSTGQREMLSVNMPCPARPGERSSGPAKDEDTSTTCHHCFRGQADGNNALVS